MAGTRRAAALCILLPLLVFSLANPSPVEASCVHRTPMMPFCHGWMCKTECWLEAKLFLATVKEHRCAKKGIKGYCYCLFCGTHLVKGGIKGYCYCLFCGKNLKKDEGQEEKKPQELIH